LRIIGGTLRGRTLAEFKGYEVRPTPDKVRESLFNILGGRIVGSSFLDLFGGTGAIGIEAYSRGAKKVIINEREKDSLLIIKKNLEKTGTKEEIELSAKDSLLFLHGTSEKFDFVYLDPPYKSDLIMQNALAIMPHVLKENGVAIAESEYPFLRIKGLILTDQRKYGRVYIAFYKKAVTDTCVFAGTFDPVTKGHIDIIRKAKKLYKKVEVVVAVNAEKEPLFSENERVELIRKAVRDIDGVTVKTHTGLMMDFMRDNGYTAYIRGVRGNEDTDYENLMERNNKAMYPELENVVIKADEEYEKISSTAVKKAFIDGEDVGYMLPESIYEEVIKKLSERI